MEHILLITGKLARKSLERVVESMQTEDFSFEIRSLQFTVASLMTTDMILRHLGDPGKADRIIIPGLSIGAIDTISKNSGVPVERGPKDLKDLPVFFGQAAQHPDLSHYDVRIFAEIVDGPDMTVKAILEQASSYQADGADIIDIGCLPGRDFPHLAETVKTLANEGYIVSVDSMNPKQLICGAHAGAAYLLSLHESTLWVADEVESVPILIPENPEDIKTLYRIIDIMLEKDKAFIADSIIDPIHFGFVQSISRYHQLRAEYPQIEIMMGVGNLSELTEADTGGINTIMMGMMSELNINNVLTTQVSPHARRSVAELDLARRIMYRAKKDHALPKGYHSGLMSLHNRNPYPYDFEEVKEISSQVRDPHFRIQVTEDGIHIYNGEGLYTATEPYALYDNLPSLHGNASHAYYIGVELGRAQIAYQLGNRYIQDEELDWGCAYTPENQDEDKERLEYKEEPSTSIARKILGNQKRKEATKKDLTDKS